MVAIGELLLPTEGFAGLALRTALWFAYPLALLATGFFSREERSWLARLRHPGELATQLRSMRPAPAGVDGQVPETYEAELRDEDTRL